MSDTDERETNVLLFFFTSTLRFRRNSGRRSDFDRGKGVESTYSKNKDKSFSFARKGSCSRAPKCHAEHLLRPAFRSALRSEMPRFLSSRLRHRASSP